MPSVENPKLCLSEDVAVPRAHNYVSQEAPLLYFLESNYISQEALQIVGQDSGLRTTFIIGLCRSLASILGPELHFPPASAVVGLINNLLHEVLPRSERTSGPKTTFPMTRCSSLANTLRLEPHFLSPSAVPWEKTSVYKEFTMKCCSVLANISGPGTTVPMSFPDFNNAPGYLHSLVLHNSSTSSRSPQSLVLIFGWILNQTPGANLPPQPYPVPLRPPQPIILSY